MFRLFSSLLPFFIFYIVICRSDISENIQIIFLLISKPITFNSSSKHSFISTHQLCFFPFPADLRTSFQIIPYLSILVEIIFYLNYLRLPQSFESIYHCHQIPQTVKSSAPMSSVKKYSDVSTASPFILYYIHLPCF